MMMALTAIRNLRRSHFYTYINMIGLALSLAAVAAIFLYVIDELSYDGFHLKGNRIYRINSTSRFAGSENRYSTTAAPLADAIRSDVLPVERTARLFERQAALQVVQPADPGRLERQFREDHFFFADPEIFHMLSFNFLSGDPHRALENHNQLVINERTAIRYFGSAAEAMGKEFMFEGNLPLTVSAVITDYPEQSHLQIDMIAHFENYYKVEPENIRDYLRRDWIYNTVSTYILLREGSSPDQVETEINSLKKKYADGRVANGVTYELQPLPDIHLYSRFSFGNESANIIYVYVLGSIAMLVLLIGCVNFINLSTVQALKRAREIGVRKVLGARKSGLVGQFFSESAALVAVSFLMAIVVLSAALPFVNVVSEKNFHITDLLTWKAMTGLLVLLLITAALAGTYPSFYITRFQPVEASRGLTGRKLAEGYVLRKFLVVAQFTISTCLVVLAIIFYNQMEFVRSKPLGFQRELMLNVPLFSSTPNSILGGGVDGSLRGRMNVFESELLREGTVEAVTVSSALPGFGAVFALVQTDSIREQDNVFIAATAVDYDFIDTYKMDLVAGRNFSRDFGTDHMQAVIINEQAVAKLGWKTSADAIGKSLTVMDKNAYVIGVVKDFHFQGLQQPLRPLIMEVAAAKFNVFSMRLDPKKDVQQSVMSIQAFWGKSFPEKVFEYHFLDDQLVQTYGNEQRMTNMIQYFSMLAIFICALGLFGLSAHLNHQRSKEVSIRKVLGASPQQIFHALSRDFIIMAAIAFTISTPLVIILSGRWLETFAYRATVSVWPYVAGGVVSLTVVLLTISYELIRTASVNPAEKLRSE
jgi:putative ABC transport system permease protein